MKIINQLDGQYVLRFDANEELVGELVKFCIEKNITGAWFSGLGSSQEATVAFFDLPAREYRDQRLNQRLEIASLTGNVALVDDKPFVHMHGVFADPTLIAKAGHIKKLIVGATCEIRLEAISGGLVRKHDKKTGLNLLD